MKTLGIIGGIGPESTMEYYRSVIALYRERSRNGSYPQFIINSIDLKEELDYVERGDLAGLTEMLLFEIGKLARAGADFGLIASNTGHISFDDVQRRSPIPLLSIIETACRAAKKRGLRRIGIFGTRFTMQGQFYHDVFARERIEVIIPNPADQDFIHDKYMNELVAGQFLPETHAGLLAIIDKLKRDKAVDAVILAGTELPLILREPSHNGIPILDTMRIHVQAALAEMFR